MKNSKSVKQYSNKLRILLFLTLLYLFINTAYSQTTTTPNLTPQSFTTINGWSGTNLSSTHGNGTIAGVSGQSIENTISLTNVGLSQAQINEGFTSTQGADIWFWSGNQNQNVTMTQILTGSNGEVITQNRIVPYASSYYNTYDNIIIVDKNTQVNYNITSKFSFYESSNSPYHAAADLKNPTLSITYITNPTPPIVIPVFELPTFLAPTTGGTITELITEEQIKEIFKEEFAKVGLTEADVGMTNLDYKEMATQINTQAVADMKEASPTLFGSPEPTSSTAVSTKEEPTATVKEEPKILTKQEPTTTSAATETTTSTSTENTTAMTKEEPTTSTKESNATTSSDKETTSVSEKTNTNTDTKSEESKTTTSQSATNENQKAEGSQTEKVNEKAVSDKSVTTNEKGTVNVGVNSIEAKVKTAIDKVEKELKNIEQRTKLIQEIKLEGIKAGSPNLSTYENRFIPDGKTMVGVPNLDFYNQINIYQEQIYKDVSLSAYITKDPIAVKQNLLNEIEDEKNSIILEIEMLTRNLKKG